MIVFSISYYPLLPYCIYVNARCISVIWIWRWEWFRKAITVYQHWIPGKPLPLNHFLHGRATWGFPPFHLQKLELKLHTQCPFYSRIPVYLYVCWFEQETLPGYENDRNEAIPLFQRNHCPGSCSFLCTTQHQSQLKCKSLSTIYATF